MRETLLNEMNIEMRENVAECEMNIEMRENVVECEMILK